MIKKILREFSLLTRGDQRALLVLSLLLFLSLLVRITVGLLPERDLPGTENFIRESQMLMTELASAERLRGSSYPASEIAAPARVARNEGSRSFRQPSPKFPIDLNRADSATLLPLPGIGPVLAGRILKYRDLLGGYTGINQLYEVYGLEAEVISLIQNLVAFDTLAIRKISLDSASFRELLRHPYLNLEDVKALVQYRDYKGEFHGIQEIRENSLLSDTTLQKLNSYLGFGH